jgi:hypothetical protein
MGGAPVTEWIWIMLGMGMVGLLGVFIAICWLWPR